jgi:hypothetical protein
MAEDVNKKLEQLQSILAQRTGGKITSNWDADFRCFRFDFERHDGKRYLLDLHEDFLLRDVDKTIEQLEAEHYEKVLEAQAGKSVPCFGADNKFADASTFREWPSPSR